MFPPRKWSPVDKWTSNVPTLSHPTMQSVPAVLVHLGHTVPWHLYDCLQQLATFDTPCILVVSSTFVGSWFQNIPHVKVWHYDDRQIVRDIEEVQPSGLFTLSIARFYALAAAMQHFNLDKCIHMEHDNLVYASGAWLSHMSTKVCGVKLGITQDSAHRCIAGWMWIGSQAALHAFLAFMTKHNYAKYEMFLLCDFMKQHPEFATRLPVVPPSSLISFPHSKWDHTSVFDAAALGQWVGGIDLLHSEKDTRGFVNETAEYNPDMFNFAWGADTQGRTVPVVEYHGVQYRVLNLHMHSKRLYPFLSVPCQATDIIQGHKFRDLAETLGQATVFVVSHKIADVRALLDQATSPIVVMSHNSDHGLEIQHLDMLNHPMLKWWFAQNLNVNHPKTSPLPIGLANSQWPHGNVPQFRQAISTFVSRPIPRLYANFSVGTHPVRKEFLQLMKQNTKNATRVTPLDNWRAARHSALVACPRGNGIDTHRLWETWYSSSMPVRYQPDKKAWKWAFRHLGLPWIELTDVTAVTPHQDLWTRWNHARYYNLRFTYWANLIRAKLHDPESGFWDACVVVHAKDYQWVERVVEGLRQYTLGCRRIYIVTNQAHKVIDKWPTTTVVDEKDIEPCSLDYVRQLGFQHRAGWYYQQLLKLNLDKLPGCLPQVLVIDADTVLCQHTTFWDDYGRALFSHFPVPEPYYQQHILRLCPQWAPLKNTMSTAVVHHMPFDVPALQQMKQIISEQHKQPFHVAFLNQVLPAERLHSGCSEYELYFQYRCYTAPDQVVVRQLRHLNTSNVNMLSHAQHPYTMISVHSYLRN